MTDVMPNQIMKRCVFCLALVLSILGAPASQSANLAHAETDSAGAAAISLSITVSTTPDCGSSNTIVVNGAAAITYCYIAHNVGTVALTTHTLTDDKYGAIFSSSTLTLTPNSTYQITRTVNVNQTTVNNATWSASGSGSTASSNANAAVVIQPNVIAKLTASTNGICGDSSTISAAPGATVLYCYTLQNGTSDALKYFSLSDNKFGVLQSNLVYDSLLPGEVLGPFTRTATLSETTTNVSNWIASNGVLSYTASATATVNVTPPSISLKVTVGKDPSSCASTTTLSALPGDTLAYCYTMKNNGPAIMRLHTITDNKFGAMSPFVFEVQPNESYSVIRSIVVSQSVTNTVTWVATDGELGSLVIASATASASISVTPPSISLQQTYSANSNQCGTSSNIDVLKNTPVTVCYTVKNTGTITLTTHTLTDNAYGAIATNLAHTLPPNATFSITKTVTPITTTTTTGTWTAFIGPASVAATSSATVNVVEYLRTFLALVLKLQ